MILQWFCPGLGDVQDVGNLQLPDGNVYGNVYGNPLGVKLGTVCLFAQSNFEIQTIPISELKFLGDGVREDTRTVEQFNFYTLTMPCTFLLWKSDGLTWLKPKVWVQSGSGPAISWSCSHILCFRSLSLSPSVLPLLFPGVCALTRANYWQHVGHLTAGHVQRLHEIHDNSRKSCKTISWEISDKPHSDY